MQSASPAKRVTMTDVAHRAGVSVMTASYTYNRPDRVAPDSRAKVLAAAEELGYGGPDPAARSLRYGNTRTLGLLLGEHLTYAFEDPQASAFLAGIAEVCADRGYGLLIVPITGADDDAARVAASAVDAFIVWTTADDDPILDAVGAARRPVVIHGGPARNGFTLVSINNRAAAHAVGLRTFAGAKHPAVISFPLDRTRRTILAAGIDPTTARFPVTRERLQGYQDAARELGIDWSKVLVGVCATNDDGEANTLTEQMLARHPLIDAIAAMSDQQALGALRASAAQHRPVPQTLAISGWDDSTAASQNGLTTIAQNLREQGSACALAALGDSPASSADAWSLIERQTTPARV